MQHKNISLKRSREGMARTASSPNIFPFLAGCLALNSLMLWLIYRWIRNREEVAALTSAETDQNNARASQEINTALKDLMVLYEELQVNVQEMKDDLAILRKEKRDFQEEIRALEQKANEQDEKLNNVRVSLESELKNTKDNLSAQLGRVIVFHDEIQEHKKRIADLEAKLAKYSEEIATLQHRENGPAEDIPLL
ncbi:hypothetical protein RB195_008398 [Necator americanus]|uniref:Uncharacterized protein n=1 Tax=Necator americanus TaxID=51031 RepID=A0ABR1CNG2_NECAM